MYAPCYLPPAAPVSQAVRDVERAMLDAEGPFYVAGRYIADADLAARERRLVAEQSVSAAERRARASAADRTPAARVVTWLRDDERAALTLAIGRGDGATVAHRETLADVRALLAMDGADVVVVSLVRLTPADVPALAAIVRAFPGVPVAGIVAPQTSAAPIGGALLAGRAGVRCVFDVGDRRGWGALRSACATPRRPDAFQHACAASVVAELRQRPDGTSDDGAGIPDALARFFIEAFAPDVTTVGEIAERLGVRSTTLTCRFFRAGLPSPRKYLVNARLAWAAWLGEQPGRTLSAIASRLDASSAQALSRTVRLHTGLTCSEFRRRYTGAAMLGVYRETLVTPFRETLRRFDPLAMRDAGSRHPCLDAVPGTRAERRAA